MNELTHQRRVHNVSKIELNQISKILFHQTKKNLNYKPQESESFKEYENGLRIVPILSRNREIELECYLAAAEAWWGLSNSQSAKVEFL